MISPMCFTFCTRFRASRGVRIKVRLTGSLPMAGFRGLGQMHHRSLRTERGEGSRYMTGAVLVIDGGYTLW